MKTYIILFLILLFAVNSIAIEMPDTSPSHHDQQQIDLYYKTIRRDNSESYKIIQVLQMILNMGFESPEWEKVYYYQIIDALRYFYWIREDLDGFEKYARANKKEHNIELYYDDFLQQCKVFYNRGEYDKAKAILNELWELVPDHEAAHIDMGYILIKEKDYQGAHDHFQKFEEHNPDDNEIPLLKGIALYHLGRYEEAKSEFSRSNSRKRGNALTRFYLTLAYNQIDVEEKRICRLLRLAKWHYEKGEYDLTFLMPEYDKEMIDDIMPEVEKLDAKLQEKGYDTSPIPGEKPPWEK